MRLRNLINAGAALALLGVASTASAASITYTGVRVIGADTAGLVITTDGVLGSIAANDITNYTVTLTSPTYGDNVLTPTNSSLSVIGNDLTATATNLSYDFTNDGSSFDIQMSTMPFEFYCDQGSCYTTTAPGEGIGTVTLDLVNPANTTDQEDTVSHSGNLVIASTVPVSALPEPSSWALMIIGVFFAGLGIRGMKTRQGFSSAMPA